MALPFLPDVGKKTPTGTLLLVGRLGMNWLLLVKDDERDTKSAVTPTEERWLKGWRGQVMVVETLSQALGLVVPSG